MSEITEIKDSNYYIDWLDNSITEELIKYYEYSEFTSIQRIGKGSFGKVCRVNWKKNSDRFFALKFFYNDAFTLKEVVKEVQKFFLLFNNYMFFRCLLIIFYKFIYNNVRYSQLKLHKHVDDHDNIIRLYGITKVSGNDSGESIRTIINENLNIYLTNL
jgi:serine/threonine protein kinase